MGRTVAAFLEGRADGASSGTGATGLADAAVRGGLSDDGGDLPGEPTGEPPAELTGDPPVEPSLVSAGSGGPLATSPRKGSPLGFQNTRPPESWAMA